MVSGGKWALGGDEDLENLDNRIQSQQQDIQKELNCLARLQRELGLKTLPSLQQKVLQADLQKLQAIQGELKKQPGNGKFQMQLIGQQMMLLEHLFEIQESLSYGIGDVESQLELMTSQKSSSNLKHGGNSLGNVQQTEETHSYQPPPQPNNVPPQQQQ